MKKKYISPTLLITKVNSVSMIAQSFRLNNTGSDGTVLVKENRTYRDYNVWDDDWSN
ncbi:MAG: hypothetical protein K6G70_08170 [Bacteroidaceae bacterium]|nr:hypothetical protein [Bacteroidaceae bacterium]